MTGRSANVAQAMLSATCHCGSVRIHVRRAPRTVTRCNCSICRRYGALWAYYPTSSVQIQAPVGGLSKFLVAPQGARLLSLQ
jgi:hypothetical protein